MTWTQNTHIAIVIILAFFVSNCSSSDSVTNASSSINSDAGSDMSENTDKDTDKDTDENSEEEGAKDAPPTNPFIETNHDPFSTFAADVDTASYDIFRQSLDYNQLPDAATVRLEEFVNYFKYDYQIPSDVNGHPFSLSLDAAPGIFNNDTKLLRVGIQGGEFGIKKKQPTNLVFLIDVSGSMGTENKLTLVNRVVSKTLNILQSGDMVSIVTYSSQTSVRLMPTDATDKSAILSVVNSLSAWGNTNGSDGINLAYAQAENAFIEDGINHVVLCTDGNFNFNTSDTPGLVKLITQKRETGITLAVLGFGRDLNDEMMEEISNAGNGIYGVIFNETQADDYVKNKMLSSLVFIAKDMKIQVEFNPEFVAAYRLLGYENRAVDDEDFRDDTVDGGEIGSGHRVTALYELVMVGTPIPLSKDAPDIETGDSVEGDREVDPNDMVLVKVRYKDPDATTEDEAYEVRESMQMSNISADLEGEDTDFQWAVAVAAFAEILKGSPYSNISDLSQIESIITSETWADPDRTEFVNLFNTARNRLEK